MALAVALFAWLGNWTDQQLGSSPLFVLIGLALGLVGGFIHVVNALAPDLLPFGRRPSDPDSDKEEPSSPED